MEKMVIPKQSVTNVSPALQQALVNLQLYDHLVITQSDKGGNLVIIDQNFYRDMCLSILNNPYWYQNISPLMMNNFYEKFYKMVNDAYYQDLIPKAILGIH